MLYAGGCGAMYEIHIESDEFKGKRTVQQHQLVNQVTITLTPVGRNDLSLISHNIQIDQYSIVFFSAISWNPSNLGYCISQYADVWPVPHPLIHLRYYLGNSNDLPTQFHCFDYKIMHFILKYHYANWFTKYNTIDLQNTIQSVFPHTIVMSYSFLFSPSWVNNIESIALFIEMPCTLMCMHASLVQ